LGHQPGSPAISMAIQRLLQFPQNAAPLRRVLLARSTGGSKGEALSHSRTIGIQSLIEIHRSRFH
jgi:hypothetical protein